MSRAEAIFLAVMEGGHDAALRFGALTALARSLGFSERIKGDHHIYYKDGVVEILNFQPDGNKAKPYQVRQLRGIISKYGLELTENE